MAWQAVGHPSRQARLAQISHPEDQHTFPFAIAEDLQDPLHLSSPAHELLRRRHRHPLIGLVEKFPEAPIFAEAPPGAGAFAQGPGAPGARVHPGQMPVLALARIRQMGLQQGLARCSGGVGHRGMVGQLAVEAFRKINRVAVEYGAVPTQHVRHPRANQGSYKRFADVGLGLATRLRCAAGGEKHQGRLALPQHSGHIRRAHESQIALRGFPGQHGHPITAPIAMAGDVHHFEGALLGQGIL